MRNKIEKIFVTICSIKVQKKDGSVETISDQEETYELLELRDKIKLLLETELEEGEYTHIMICVCKVTIIHNGVTYEITITPCYEVKIPVSFHIRRNRTTEVVLDFEADHSIGIGPLGQFIFTPVISLKRITH